MGRALISISEYILNGSSVLFYLMHSKLEVCIITTEVCISEVLLHCISFEVKGFHTNRHQVV